MPEITDEELDLIRQEQKLYQPSVGTLQRKDHIGGGNFGWKDLVVDQRVRITAGQGGWTNLADRFSGINPVVITFPHDTDVQAGDRFISNGDIFEVRETRKQRSYLTAIQCLCDHVN